MDKLKAFESFVSVATRGSLTAAARAEGVAPAMALHFGQLIAHAARTRRLRAGTVLGSGTISHPGVADAKGRMQWPQGCHSLADKRSMESLQDGQPSTPFMAYGDTVRIDMKGQDGHSVFGAIEQTVAEG